MYDLEIQNPKDLWPKHCI